MLDTSKNILFPGHNHLLTTGTGDSLLAGTQVINQITISVSYMPSIIHLRNQLSFIHAWIEFSDTDHMC